MNYLKYYPGANCNIITIKPRIDKDNLIFLFFLIVILLQWRYAVGT